MWRETTHKYTHIIPCGPRMGTYHYNVKAVAYVIKPDHTYVEFEDGSGQWVLTERLQKITLYKGE